MNQPEDLTALLDAVRAGSLDALGQLYARFGAAVYTTALRITAAPHEAEDVLQEVFLGLPRALGSYRERGRFEPWLRRLAARAALMHLRTQRRKREDAWHAPSHEDVSMTMQDPTAPVLLERLIARLPDTLRVVFVLREVEGYSHADIAGLLGISTTNSAARLSRAWTFLRKEARR